MKIVGCDLHARQQTLAMIDAETGECTEKTLVHHGNAVREFCAGLRTRSVDRGTTPSHTGKTIAVRD